MRLKLHRGKYAALALCAIFTLFSAGPIPARDISPLAPNPDWKVLDHYQGSITAENFRSQLDSVYAPGEAWKETITIESDHASIRRRTTAEPPYILKFAPSQDQLQPAPRYWRSAAELSAAKDPKHPLEGIHIAIDAGHIGGKWAQMEERWFQIGTAKPVMEGEMTLDVAKRVQAQLEALGAKVTQVRKANKPVSRIQPGRLEDAAREVLSEKGITAPQEKYAGRMDPKKQDSIQWQAELLSYRTREIRERAELVNQRIKPDLVLCLHFNAEPWGDPANPQLVEKNHLHFLTNGAYSAKELQLVDVRFEMLLRLLQGTHREELGLAKSVAGSMAAATGLPPYEYPGGNAIRMAPYVWGRNLIANRLYDCPVVFAEPYVMNNREVFARVQLGDYEGVRDVEGVPRRSIYREYADSVTAGLVEYFKTNRQGAH